MSYDSLRKEFLRSQMDLNRAFYEWIKHLVTLSTLMLSLAISFRQTLLGNLPEHPWLLQSALALLTISLLSGAIAHYGQIKLFEAEMRMYLKMIQNGAEMTADTALTPKIYKICFWFQVVFFFLGVLLFAYFGIVNI